MIKILSLSTVLFVQSLLLRAASDSSPAATVSGSLPGGAAAMEFRGRGAVDVFEPGAVLFTDRHEDKPWSQNDGERLYNGIVLPKEWPPRNMDLADKGPMPVPYLDFPPEVIPIDVGRQLFVDDFLIERTDLTRTFHLPEKFAGNPVLKPDTSSLSAMSV